MLLHRINSHLPVCVVWVLRGGGFTLFPGWHRRPAPCFPLQVHPFFPDPVYIFHWLLHPRRRGEQDAGGCLASDGAQQPLLLVSDVRLRDEERGPQAGALRPPGQNSLQLLHFRPGKLNFSWLRFAAALAFARWDNPRVARRRCCPCLGCFFSHAVGRVLLAGALALGLRGPWCLSPPLKPSGSPSMILGRSPGACSASAGSRVVGGNGDAPSGCPGIYPEPRPPA